MPDAVSPARGDTDAKQRAIDCLWQLNGRTGVPRQANLYVILDAARDPAIYQGLRQLSGAEQVVSLYQGPTARELAGVAPYLVSMGTTDRVFDWIWAHGWGNSWGIFFWSLVSPETLRAHFRRLTIVRGPKGERLLFRFYDPRVMRIFAPGCDATQIKELFGPVARFMVEDETGSAILSFRPRNDAVVTESVALVD